MNFIRYFKASHLNFFLLYLIDWLLQTVSNIYHFVSNITYSFFPVMYNCVYCGNAREGDGSVVARLLSKSLEYSGWFYHHDQFCRNDRHIVST